MIGSPRNSSFSGARPDLLDRNGEILATDVKTMSVFAEPNRIIDIAHEITGSVGRIEVKRGATSIKAGMDTFIWRKASPHDRSKGAWNHPKYTLPYSPEDWRRVFPDGLREMVKDRELEMVAHG